MTGNRNYNSPNRGLRGTEISGPYQVERQIRSYPFVPQESIAREIISTPEPTESIIARQKPGKVARLIDKISRRQEREKQYEIGEEIANNLINQISEEEREEISEIEIIPNKTIKKGFLGFGAEKGLVIKLKKEH